MNIKNYWFLDLILVVVKYGFPLLAAGSDICRKWGEEATVTVPHPQGVMGGNIGVLALGVGMEVVVGIFLLVFWFAIFVLIAGLAFLIDFLLFEFTFLMFM